MTQRGIRRISMLGALGALVFAGCAAEVPDLRPDTKDVLVRKGDPPAGYTEVGPVSVRHGSGCGVFGEFGSYEGAMAMMKNRGAELKADYVRIDVAVEPHVEEGCSVNQYVLRGVAFRRGAPAPVAQLSGNTISVMGDLVGQAVVLRLASGEVLAGTLASVTPPDGVKVVLLDKSVRDLHSGDIAAIKPNH